MHVASTLLASAFVCASSVAAQSVWVVDQAAGPGTDFVAITDAVSAASDGDFILVKDGGYAPVTIDDKALTIQSASGVSPLVRQFHVQNLAAGKSVVVRGFDVQFDQLLGTAPGLRATDNQGRVWFEDCRILHDFLHGARVRTTIEVSDSSSVHFARIESSDDMLGGLPALAMITNASVVFTDSTLLGVSSSGSFFIDPEDGGAALSLVDASARLVGTTVVGGSGGFGIAGCIQGGDGGPGVVLAGASSLRVLGASLAGGAAGSGSGGCPDGAPGADVDTSAGGTATVLGSAAPALVFASPHTAGTAIAWSLETLGGSAAWFVASDEPLGGLALPAYTGALLLSPPWIITFLGAVPASGTLSNADLPFVLGLPPGVLADRLLEQVFSFHPTTGLVAGGISAITILDPAF